MATEFKITGLETVSRTTHLYLVVEFYVDNVLVHVEDFIIGRPAEKRVYTGLIGPDDEILEPEAYTVELIDIRQEILDVIQDFERRHRGDVLLTGHQGAGRTSRTSDGIIKRDDSDPNGWLERADIQALKDVKVRV